MAIKVLFVPNEMPSHIIPLIALGKMLPKSSFDCAFLLPRKYHEYVQHFGLAVLDIDKRPEDRTTPEMIAISKFKPNVVVDDLSYTTAFSTRFAKLPRISVVRKGILPHEKNLPGYEHSSSVVQFLANVSKMNLKSFGMWEPKHHAELFIGDINIIPALPSVEVLPVELTNNSSYIYAGSLLVSDEEMLDNMYYLKLPMAAKNLEDSRKPLEQFLEENKSRQKVYFTKGITAPAEIQKKAAACVISLLNKNVAVITNLGPIAELTEAQGASYFTSALLPMHKVCSSVDVMIHHCGSGTYNYQLMHQVPAIILGSKFYDRDEVALRLQELEAACYISADLDDDSYQNKFDAAVSALLDTSSGQYLQQKAALAKLHTESVAIQKSFDFGNIIRRLVKAD